MTNKQDWEIQFDKKFWFKNYNISLSQIMEENPCIMSFETSHLATSEELKSFIRSQIEATEKRVREEMGREVLAILLNKEVKE